MYRRCEMKSPEGLTHAGLSNLEDFTSCPLHRSSELSHRKHQTFMSLQSNSTLSLEQPKRTPADAIGRILEFAGFLYRRVDLSLGGEVTTSS